MYAIRSYYANERHFILSITGSGDPFASRVYRDLLHSLDGRDFPNLEIALQTNGVLLTPRNWERMKRVHGNISSIIISFDAASEATYNVTRRGGHWPTRITSYNVCYTKLLRLIFRYFHKSFGLSSGNLASRCLLKGPKRCLPTSLSMQ